MTPGASRATAVAGRLLVALGALVTGGAAIVRYTGLQEFGFRMMGVAAASIPVVTVASTVMLVGVVLVLLAGRQRPPGHARRGLRLVLVPTALSLAVVVHMALPALVGLLLPERAGEGERFSVLAQNLYFENERPAATLDAVLARGADVVVLTEFTPDFDRLLDGAHRAEQVRGTYPYQWRQPEPRGAGLAVLSSLPFAEAVRVPLSAPAVALQLRVGDEQVDLYAVHPMAPSDRWGLLQWQHDQRVLLADAVGAGPATVMAGDFNASSGHRAFRRLLDMGQLRDAQDVGGGGLAGTWPVTGWLPELMRLDHVLVGEGIGVERFEMLPRTGSDHRGIEAWLRVPRS